MTNPFKVGDKVFTPTGEATIQSVLPTGCYMEEEGLWWPNNCISFKPWPAPCHERPVQDGWWICTCGHCEEPYIRQVVGGSVLYYGRAYRISEYRFHRYLGKDWK